MKHGNRKWRRCDDTPEIQTKNHQSLATSATEILKRYSLSSYTDFKEKFDKLTLEERIALLALGWYARPGLT